MPAAVAMTVNLLRRKPAGVEQPASSAPVRLSWTGSRSPNYLQARAIEVALYEAPSLPAVEWPFDGAEPPSK
jgi:hypothetical protein